MLIPEAGSTLNRMQNADMATFIGPQRATKIKIEHEFLSIFPQGFVCFSFFLKFSQIWGVPKSIQPTSLFLPQSYSMLSSLWNPSKYSPFDWTTCSQRLFHFWKQSWYSLFGIALKTFVALISVICTSSNYCPLSGVFNFGNSQKLQGAMSGLRGLTHVLVCYCGEVAHHCLPKDVDIFFLFYRAIFS